MGYLTVYIIVGLIFLMVIESLGKSLKITTKIGNKERIAISVLWPLALCIFLIALITQIIKHKK